MIERIDTYMTDYDAARRTGMDHGYTVAVLEIQRMIDELDASDPQFEYLLTIVRALNERRAEAIAE